MFCFPVIEPWSLQKSFKEKTACILRTLKIIYSSGFLIKIEQKKQQTVKASLRSKLEFVDR